MLKMKTDGGTSLTTKSEPKIHYINKVIGGDTYLVMAQSAVELEDEFSNLYFTTASATNQFLEPPFTPQVLMNLANTNNMLLQCIEAMEVNIDGTGHSFVPKEEGGNVDDDELKIAQGFFGEPCPNQSFVKIRRKLRRQMESVGYGFLEVLRSLTGEVVGLRNLETQSVRFVKLDAPVMVKKVLTRNGKDVEIQMLERERRFAQRVALVATVYYREFGSSRQVNRATGEWETKDKPLAPEQRGTELLLFGIHPDVTTPYYLPRWINQLPSVVGSRKAEEANLQFLDSGGLPPAIIFVQGGTLAKDASDQLKMYLSGANKNKYRAVVVEAQSSSGSLDSSAQVQVKVERFGAQAAQDAMFQKYDTASEEHVRVGFRLPQLFVGKSQDQNFATAAVAYMVAEAQVFGSERQEFDEMINMTIIPALGIKSLKIKSNPITMRDIANQLRGVELSKDLATRESSLKEINTITGMSLELAALPQPDTVSETIDPTGKSVGKDSTVPNNTPTVGQTPHGELPASTKPASLSPSRNVVTLTPPVPKVGPKAKKATELISIAHDFAASNGLIKKASLTPERVLLVKQEVEELEGEDLSAFNTLMAMYLFEASEQDTDLAELAGMVV